MPANAIIKPPVACPAMDEIKKEEISSYRMAARNGNELPKHIIDRIKKTSKTPEKIADYRP